MTEERTGEFTGVVDRIVEETAVVLIEEDDEVVEQVSIPAEQVPAIEEGRVLTVVFDAGNVVDLRDDEAETRNRRESIRDRFDRLTRDLSEE